MTAQPSEPMLVVRACEQSDLAAVTALGPLLSSRSLYQRFFVGTSRLPQRALDRLATLDHDRHEAVLGWYAGELVGWAQYDVWPDQPQEADIAVLIADPWQGLGIGPQLVRALVPLARRRGFTALTATVLPDNRHARAVLGRLWPGAAPVVREGALWWRLPLGPVRPRGVHDLAAGCTLRIP